MRMTLLVLFLGAVAGLFLMQGFLHIRALDYGLDHYKLTCNSGGGFGGSCKSQLEKEFKILKEKSQNGNKGELTTRFISQLGNQSVFIILAFVIAALCLAFSTLLSIFIEWLENERGAGKVANLFQNVLDTIPYTVWLLLVLALWDPAIDWTEELISDLRASVSHLWDPVTPYLWDPVIHWIEGLSVLQYLGNARKMSVLAGQMVIYIGVFLLLLPLFLVLILHKIRAARRDYFFDAMAMDGASTFQRYKKVVRYRLWGTLAKFLMFSTAFVIMFDATLITLVGGDLPDNTAIINPDFPEQYFISPFAQLAMLEKKKNRRLVDVEKQIKNWSYQTRDNQSRDWLDWRSYRALAWFDDMATWHSIMRGRTNMDKLAPRQKLALMQRYPGLRMSTDWWFGAGSASKLECGSVELCKAMQNGQTIPADLMKSAQWNGMITVYFYFVLTIITILFGSVAIQEINGFLGVKHE